MTRLITLLTAAAFGLIAGAALADTLELADGTILETRLRVPITVPR